MGSYSKKEKALKPFGLLMKSMLQQSKISVKNIHLDIFPKTPPWILEKPEVILKLKTKTHPCTYIEKFHHHIVSHNPEHLHVLKDGSKDHSRTTCAAVLNKVIHQKALPMESSIFNAEVCAIHLALNIISRDKHNTFIIFSDSLSVLTSLKNKKLENPLIVKLLSRLDSMSRHKSNFVLDSKPHRSERKRKSRLAAKSALDLSPKAISIPYTDLKPIISKFLHKKMATSMGHEHP